MRLIDVRVRLRRLRKAVVNLGAQVAGRAGVELLLGHTALLVVAHDLELMHVVGLLAKESLGLVFEHPPCGLPDVLVHGRRGRADHPTAAVAMTHVGADPLRCIGVPELVPGLHVEIAHDLLILGAVARHDIAVGIDEERVKRHVTRQQTGLAIDVINKAVVEVGAKPFLGFAALEELVDERFEVLGNHRAIMDDVLGLDKVEAIVERCGCELHTHLIGNLVERHEIWGIEVLHRHTEAYVRMIELDELLERRITALVAIRDPTNGVVGLLEALDGNADTNLRELFAQINDSIGEEAVGGYYDTVGLLIELAHDVLEIRSDERLAARDIGEIHLGKLLNGLKGDLLVGATGSLVSVAHSATSVAAIRNDDCAVEFLI